VITTVVFDADETLVDLRPAVQGALLAVLDEVRGRGAAGLTPADLQADWAAAFAVMTAEPVRAIRRAALTASLTRCGLGGEFAFEVYAHRDGLPKKPGSAVLRGGRRARGRDRPHRRRRDHDVAGPQEAGMPGVWFNRPGCPCRTASCRMRRSVTWRRFPACSLGSFGDGCRYRSVTFVRWNSADPVPRGSVP
jgi:FMN hydrolase / 5-amino-6-(5-phospho-D-ribitylamino)uracil phosphatase